MAGEASAHAGEAIDPRFVLVRRIAIGLYVAILLTVWATRGVSIDRVGITLWIVAGLSVWVIGRGWRAWLRVMRDWGIFQGLLLLYDYGYGLAGRFTIDGLGPYPQEGDTNVLGIPLHVTWPIEADRFLFGGELPNQWLQERLADGIPWWAWFVTLVYCSHFFAAPVLAVVLWVRSRDTFHVWVRMMFVLAGAGIATYFLYPMSPPWLASEQAYIDGSPIIRQSSEGWTQLDFHLAHQVLQDGQYRSNPVAAMPSLHMATAVLVAGFLMLLTRRWWLRVVCLLYPISMAFTLMYTGEHYAIDVIMGTLLAVAVLGGWQWLRRRRLARAALAEAQAVIERAQLIHDDSERESTPVPSP